MAEGCASRWAVEAASASQRSGTQSGRPSTR
jgi:hypothetical protein